MLAATPERRHRGRDDPGRRHDRPARFRVEAVDNYFFDVSHGDLTVADAGRATTAADPVPAATATPATATPTATATATPTADAVARPPAGAAVSAPRARPLA